MSNQEQEQEQIENGEAATKLPLLDRHQNIIFGVLIAAITLGGLALVFSRPAPVEFVIQPPAPTPTPGPIQVYVSGEVSRPDVYTLPWDALVKNAIEAAGGVLETGDLARLNLAQRLHDGEQIHVPGVGALTPSVAAPGTGDGALGTTGNSNYVNINTAGLEGLDTLPGIGPGLAQRIIDHREAYGPFTAIEEVMDVSGIGEAKFDDIKDLISVD